MFKNKTILILSYILLISCSYRRNPTTYYVSNNGNDRANGKTQQTAWRTIEKVNSIHFVLGDSILFKGGGVWREKLLIKYSGKPRLPIVFSRYGKGNNPKILASNKVKNWKPSGVINIWKSNNTMNNPWAPRMYEAEIFFLKNDSISWGEHQQYEPDFDNLTKEYNWTWKNGYLYIFSPSNPNTSYDSVEVPQRRYAIEQSSNKISHIVLNGINFYFAKAAGYYSGYPAVRGATNLSFKHCSIGYIAHKGARRGYGIVAFQSNFLVDSCSFNDCGRRAISFNLYRKQLPGHKRFIKNVVVRNCHFKRGYHTTSLDFDSTGDQKEYYHGDTLMHIYFYNNYIDDSEIAMKNEDKTSNGVFFQEGGSYMNDIYIFNNVFTKSTARNILVNGCDTVHIWNNTIVSHNPNRFFSSVYANVAFNKTKHVDFRNNILYSNWPNNSFDNWGVLMEHSPSKYIHCDHNLYFQEYKDPQHNGFTGGLYGYYTTDMWDRYIDDNPTLDQHSPPPANPEFVHIYKDFHLKRSSSANLAGTPVKHTFIDPENKLVKIGSFDIEGKRRNKQFPSIGAYEPN